MRTPSEAVELTRRLAPDHTNAQIAEQLNAAGLRTGTGGPFAAEHVQWIRWRHKIPYPTTWAHDGELTVTQIAEQLGISDGTVYAWINTGKLAARRGPANRLYIPFPSRRRATMPPARRELGSPTRRNQNQGCRRCSLMPPSP